jgi:hypothetical protein
MTADDQTRGTASVGGPLQGSRRRLRSLGRSALWRVARPYARRRSARAEQVARLGRLENELEHVSERHEEQLERLEDLVRELILTAESLRRELAAVDGAGGARPVTSHEGEVEG